MQNRAEIRESFKFLLLASAVTMVLWFIPFAELLTYPFRIFVTFVHETGHAIASFATLIGVVSMNIDWNGNGQVIPAREANVVAVSAGYLGSLIYGSGLLLLLRKGRYARTVAIATASAFLVAPIIFGGTVTTWIFGLALGGGLMALALKAAPRMVHFFMSFLAVQCLLNAFYDLRALMYLSAFSPGTHTDAQYMSKITGGFLPAAFWAVVWTLISLVILAYTLRVYYRSIRQHAQSGVTPGVALLDEPMHKTADPLG
jgi:hypothetical protein